MHLHGLLSITIFLLCGFAGFQSIISEKLNVLLVSPANRLMATHFNFHKELASSIATNKSVGKVVSHMGPIILDFLIESISGSFGS
jgi:hypothetical protein